MRKKTVSLGIQFNENRLTFGAFNAVGKTDKIIHSLFWQKKVKNKKRFQ